MHVARITETTKFEPTEFARQLITDSVPALGFSIADKYFPDGWEGFGQPMSAEWRGGLMQSVYDNTAYSYQCGGKDLTDKIAAFLQLQGCLVQITCPLIGDVGKRPYTIRFAEPGTRISTMEKGVQVIRCRGKEEDAGFDALAQFTCGEETENHEPHSCAGCGAPLPNEATVKRQKAVA